MTALALALALAVTPGPDQASLFRSGNAAYQEGNFEEAREAYLEILSSGYQSGELYYNLGNTHFKLGELGEAVLSYERALRLDPRDDDIRANLQLANSLLADDITPLPEFLPARVFRGIVRFVPRALLMSVTGVAWLLVGLGAAAWIVSRGERGREWARRLTLVTGFAAALGAANLGVRAWLDAQTTEGVILADEVAVYSAPSEDRNLQLFTIHEGTKVVVDQQTGDWAEIVLLDGQVGWVRAEVFEVI